MRLNDVQSHIPKMRSPGGGILSVDRTDEAAQRLLAAKQNGRDQDADDKHQAQGGARNSASDSAILVLEFASIMTAPQAYNQNQEKDLSKQTDDSATRVRENQSDSHHSHCKDVEQLLLAFD